MKAAVLKNKIWTLVSLLLLLVFPLGEVSFGGVTGKRVILNQSLAHHVQGEQLKSNYKSVFANLFGSSFAEFPVESYKANNVKLRDERLLIKGGVPLTGTVPVYGSKWGTAAIIKASLLTKKTVLLRNVPPSLDTQAWIALLSDIGVDVSYDSAKRILTINASHIKSHTPDSELVKSIRASFQMSAPLLARLGKVEMAYPGGDVIGARPIDLHLQVLSDMGIMIDRRADRFIGVVNEKNPIKNEIELPMLSISASIMGMMLASRIKEDIVLRNIPCDPIIEEVAAFLRILGVQVTVYFDSEDSRKSFVEIAGEIDDQDDGGVVEYCLLPDVTEALSYGIAGVVTGGKVSVSGIGKRHLGYSLELLNTMGVTVIEDVMSDGGNSSLPIKESLTFESNGIVQPYEITGGVSDASPNVGTDMIPFFVLLSLFASDSQKEVIFRDTIFSQRDSYLYELMGMGASIEVIEGSNLFTVRGGNELEGRRLYGKDVRGGVVLTIAALTTEEPSCISGLQHVMRGYSNFYQNLKELGASLEVSDVSGVLPSETEGNALIYKKSGDGSYWNYERTLLAEWAVALPEFRMIAENNPARAEHMRAAGVSLKRLVDNEEPDYSFFLERLSGIREAGEDSVKRYKHNLLRIRRAYESLSEAEKEGLWLAVTFHDFGYFLKNKTDGHEKRSVIVLESIFKRERLERYFSDDTRELAKAIVLNHSYFGRFRLGESVPSALLKETDRSWCILLAIQNVCDLAGRANGKSILSLEQLSEIVFFLDEKNVKAVIDNYDEYRLEKLARTVPGEPLKERDAFLLEETLEDILVEDASDIGEVLRERLVIPSFSEFLSYSVSSSREGPDRYKTFAQWIKLFSLLAVKNESATVTIRSDFFDIQLQKGKKAGMELIDMTLVEKSLERISEELADSFKFASFYQALRAEGDLDFMGLHFAQRGADIYISFGALFDKKSYSTDNNWAIIDKAA